MQGSNTSFNTKRRRKNLLFHAHTVKVSLYELYTLQAFHQSIQTYFKGNTFISSIGRNQAITPAACSKKTIHAGAN